MGEWWRQTKGDHLANEREFDAYMNSEGADAFVVVDFYMPQCGWCQKFMPEWNQVVDQVTQSYNGKVKFAAIDGTKNRGVAGAYDV